MEPDQSAKLKNQSSNSDKFKLNFSYAEILKTGRLLIKKSIEVLLNKEFVDSQKNKYKFNQINLLKKRQAKAKR